MTREYKLRIESEKTKGVFSEIHGKLHTDGDTLIFTSNEGDIKLLLNTELQKK